MSSAVTQSWLTFTSTQHGAAAKNIVDWHRERFIDECRLVPTRDGTAVLSSRRTGDSTLRWLLLLLCSYAHARSIKNSRAGLRAHPRREIVTWVIGLWVPGGYVNLAVLVNDVISLR